MSASDSDAGRRSPCTLERYRATTRILHNPAYRSSDGRLWFGNRAKPDAAMILICLTKWRAASPKNRNLTPDILFLDVVRQGELNVELLTVCEDALARWSAAISPDDRHQRDQIQWLRTRLNRWLQWLADDKGDSAMQSPFVLPPDHAERLHRWLSADERSMRIPLLSRWTSQLVCWFSGVGAALRYLRAAEELCSMQSGQVEAEHLWRLKLDLQTLRNLAGREDTALLWDVLRERLGQLPPSIELDLGTPCTSPARFRDLCRELIGQCDRRAKVYVQDNAVVASAILATLTVCKPSVTELPVALVQQCASRAGMFDAYRTLAALLPMTGEPDFSDLTETATCCKRLPDDKDILRIRQHLAAGVSRDVVCWMHRLGLLHHRAFRHVSPAGVKSLCDELSAAGFRLGAPRIEQLLPWLRRRTTARLVPQILDWIKTHRDALHASRDRQSLVQAWFDCAEVGVGDRKTLSELAQWIAPPCDTDDDSESEEVPRSLHRWAAAATYYRRLAHASTVLPTAIAKAIGFARSRQRERVYLEQLAANEDANSGQLARLDYLRRRLPVAGTNKALRTAQRAFASSAIEALRWIVQQRSVRVCRKHMVFGAASIPRKHRPRFATWIGAMDPEQRELLHATTAAYVRDGVNFKMELPLNHKWIGLAHQKGVDVHAWLGERRTEVVLDGHTLKIEVEHHPLEIFRMGDYFGTCLSLGQTNQMSLLANAHDANKQVVYGRDIRGKVVARQLIAISDAFELLGYHCYTTYCHEDERRRAACIAVMAAFCGRLASDVGINLADEGEPEPIGDHFWYDDDPRAWDAAAKRAWQDQSARPRRNSVPMTTQDAPAGLHA